jgi:hypothetical protein
MVEAEGIGKGGRATAAEEMDSTGMHEGSVGMEGGWRLLIFSSSSVVGSVVGVEQNISLECVRVKNLN